MRRYKLIKKLITLTLFSSFVSYPIKIRSDETLTGDHVQIRVNTKGTLGTGVMLRYDLSGSPIVDYFQPGTPMEGFSVQTQTSLGGSFSKYVNNNNSNWTTQGSGISIGTGALTDKSGVLFKNLTFDNRVIWEKSGSSGTSTPFDISHDYMFNDSSSFVLINTEITALQDFKTIYFSRHGDPDQGIAQGVGYPTINTRDSNNSVTAVATNNLFGITLATNENNGVGAGISGDSSLGYGSSWVTAGEYYYLATESSSTGDESIGISFKFDDVSAGDTLNFNYAYCLGANVTASRNQCNNVAFTFLNTDDGDAVYSISGTTSIGETLSTSVTTADPDGNGTISSYTWQSSSDGINWTTIGTSSTYTITSSEQGKYIRLLVSYTDGESFSESVTASSVTIGSQLHTEWLQPFAAMQNVGLNSIKKFRDLVLDKAGDCNNYGWIIDNTDFCLYSNVSNTISYVNGNSNYGGYDYANFITAVNLEKTFNDRWKGGLAYGFGTSNLDSFNFSGTIANFSSNNRHYSIFASKKISDKFRLKGMIAGSDFDYEGSRNYSTTAAESAFDADGYTAEIIGIWDIYKFIKESKSLIHLQPSLGIAFATHKQEGFSESGSGDLVTITSNEAQSILLKTGIGIKKQIPMEKGKWILVPSIDLNYEYDAYAKNNSRKIGGIVKGSSDATTFVSSENLGKHRVSAEIGADFICTQNFSFNLNADYVLADGGNQYSYGVGFKLVF